MCEYRFTVQTLFDDVRFFIFLHTMLDIRCDYTMAQVSDGKVQIDNVDLKKIVTLSTADLRFIDDIVQHVSEESGDIFMEDTGMHVHSSVLIRLD